MISRETGCALETEFSYMFVSETPATALRVDTKKMQLLGKEMYMAHGKLLKTNVLSSNQVPTSG